MKTTDNTTSPTKSKTIVVLLIFALAVAVLSSLPSVQGRIKGLFMKDDRVILAKINSSYGADAEFLILKIKDPYGIQLEIYEVKASEPHPVFRQKFDFVQDSDAYIMLDKNTTNLALADVDKDGQLDILAPSVDRNGNLRLNTFRYNHDTRSFEVYANP